MSSRPVVHQCTPQSSRASSQASSGIYSANSKASNAAIASYSPGTYRDYTASTLLLMFQGENFTLLIRGIDGYASNVTNSGANVVINHGKTYYDPTFRSK